MTIAITDIARGSPWIASSLEKIVCLLKTKLNDSLYELHTECVMTFENKLYSRSANIVKFWKVETLCKMRFKVVPSSIDVLDLMQN